MCGFTPSPPGFCHYSSHRRSVGFGVSAISCLPFRCFISLRGALALCVAHTGGTIESCCKRAIRVVSMVFPWSPHVWCCAEAIVVARVWTAREDTSQYVRSE